MLYFRLIEEMGIEYMILGPEELLGRKSNLKNTEEQKNKNEA